MPASYTPKPFESSPLEIPLAASPQAVSPEPVGPREAAHPESDLTTPQPVRRSPLPAPSATALRAETPRPFEPGVVAYDLGDFTIVQSGNPAGDMPARLRGLIAVPDGPGPHPVAVILHGAGFGCPPADDTRTTWPCAEAEQPNWTGFSYLARALADRGYIALVPGVNAQYEVAYGQAKGFDRLSALTDAHLERLAAATAGREAGFGANLVGRVDLERLVLAGHGLSAAGALAIAAPDASVPVKALLLIAPEVQPQSAQSDSEGVSASSVASVAEPLPDVPIGVILPECDGIVPELAGARIYEAARLAQDRKSLTAEVFLSGANHNAFNRFFEVDDGEALAEERAGCQQELRLDPEAQRKFLAQYAADFFDATLGAPGAEAAANAAGLDPARPEPAFLYWQAARTSLSVPADQRLRIVVPGSVAEVNTNLLGERAEIVRPAEITFCPGDPAEESLCVPGFHPPGGEPYPNTLRLAWDNAGGLYQLALPATAADLTRYAALSLRVAVDPADPRNWSRPGSPAPSFSVVLRDTVGGAAVVAIPAGTAGLAFPAGALQTQGASALWSGFTPLSSIRIPLSAFEGVDLSRVAALTFSFAGPKSGAVRIADLEFVAR
jgi:dienelactone hydrolase